MKKQNKKTILALIVATTLVVSSMVGCTSSTRAKLGGYLNEHTIEMYSGGVKVREWTSVGKVLSEENSDGYYFKDKDTGKLVEVCGDIVITTK